MASEPEHGADLFFRAAADYGYRFVFGNPGTTEAVFMDGLARHPELRFVLCLFENVATGAADGFARLSGWPALVNLHLAPGLSNGLANVHNARRSRVPMIVTVGEHDTRHLLEGSPLSGDIASLARTACKWTWTVQDAGELASVLHRATSIAMTPPQGPVCLILPTNVLTAEPRTPDGRQPSIPSLHLPAMGAAPLEDIEQAADVLLKVHAPVLLVGDAGPAAFEPINALSKLTGARIVYDTFFRRLDRPAILKSEWLPYFTEQRRAMLAQYDTLFLLGVGGFTTHFLYEYDPAPVVAPHTQVVQLDNDIESLGKNERGSLLLYGDVASSLNMLVAVVRERLGKKEQALDISTPDVAVSSTTNTNSQPPTVLSPKALMRALRQVVPEDTVLIDESVTSRNALRAEVIDTGAPISTYLSVRGGALGAGIPLALGAQLGAPQQPVIAVVGDGAAMYSIQALWTAAHYRLPILVIVCNNASYDIIKAELVRLRGTIADAGADALDTAAGLGAPRLQFAHLAEGMGVRGWTVSDTQDLLPALQAAVACCVGGAPALVDVQFSGRPNHRG